MALLCNFSFKREHWIQLLPQKRTFLGLPSAFARWTAASGLLLFYDQVPLRCSIHNDRKVLLGLRGLLLMHRCRVSASMQGQEWLSHIDTMYGRSRFIGLLAWLDTFFISAHVITLIWIGYRHKSRAVHAPHIPLWLVTMH